MAPCQLHIELERTEVSPGDRLSGAVVVEVEQECQLQQLTLTTRWRTRGEGEGDGGEGQVRVLLKDARWAPGQHRIPFTMAAPQGPSSHQGQVLSIQWVLCARAQLSWRTDPVAEVGFTLVDGEPQPVEDASLSRREARRAPLHAVMGLLMGTAFGAAGLLLLATGAEGLLKGDAGQMAMAFLGGLLFGGAGLAFFVKHLRFGFLRWVLGAEVEVEPTTVRPGERLRVRLHLCPRWEVALSEAEATLVGEEATVRQTGDGKETAEHVFREERHALTDGALTLAGGEARTLEVDVEVPEEAPASFHSKHNELRWVVKVRVASSRWVYWESRSLLTVGRREHSVHATQVEAQRHVAGRVRP
jgi:hypothetical protein